MKRFVSFLLLCSLVLFNLRAEFFGFKINFAESTSQEFDFEQYNRIKFGSDKFTLYSSSDPLLNPVEVSYDDSKSITILNSGYSGIESIGINSNVSISDDGKKLSVTGTDDDESFVFAVYSSHGELLKKAKAICDTNDLPTGVYIAIATNNRITISKKIIR